MTDEGGEQLIGTRSFRNRMETALAAAFAVAGGIFALLLALGLPAQATGTFAVLMSVVTAALGVAQLAFARRCWTAGVYVTANGVRVQNYFRDYRFPWSAVKAAGQDTETLTGRPFGALWLCDGRVVRLTALSPPDAPLMRRWADDVARQLAELDEAIRRGRMAYLHTSSGAVDPPGRTPG